LIEAEGKEEEPVELEVGKHQEGGALWLSPLEMPLRWALLKAVKQEPGASRCKNFIRGCAGEGGVVFDHVRTLALFCAFSVLAIVVYMIERNLGAAVGTRVR
jgi:hypothetical protein